MCMQDYYFSNFGQSLQTKHFTYFTNLAGYSTNKIAKFMLEKVLKWEYLGIKFMSRQSSNYAF
jgi:hypothetical protein